MPLLRKAGSGASAAVLSHLTLSSSRRHYNVIQRGHDRPVESLYEKLGFGKDSEAQRVRRTTEELRQGFEREVMSLKDPVNNATDAARLQELKEAYALLTSERFRYQYGAHYYSSNDATLHVLQDGGQVAANFNPEHQSFTFLDHSVQASQRPGDSGSQTSFGDFREAFKSATGAGANASEAPGPHSAAEERGPRAGGEVPFLLKITFEESMLGCSKRIHVLKHVRCQACSGRGAQQLRTPRKCPQCLGRGSAVLPSGTYHIERRCSYCGGEGTMPPPPCRGCRGRGVMLNQPSELPVLIPPGTTTMTVFRLDRSGHDGVRGGQAGDLVLTVMVAEHRYFHRVGNCLHAMLPVPLSTALLGGLVSVPTLDGPAMLRVPPCARNGQVLSYDEHKATPSQESPSPTSAPAAPPVLLFHLLVLVPRAEHLSGRQRLALHEYDTGSNCTEAKDPHAEVDDGHSRRARQCADLKQQYSQWFTA